MPDLEEFRARHAEIRRIISDLESLLVPEQLRIRPNARTAYGLLCDLAVKVKTHLAEEDRGLYPPLLIHQDPKIKSMAWGFISGERPLRRLFDDYHRRWLKDCNFDLSDAFLGETREVLVLIVDRIEREENLLFPKLEELGAGELADALAAGARPQ